MFPTHEKPMGTTDVLRGVVEACLRARKVTRWSNIGLFNFRQLWSGTTGEAGFSFPGGGGGR